MPPLPHFRGSCLARLRLICCVSQFQRRAGLGVERSLNRFAPCMGRAVRAAAGHSRLSSGPGCRALGSAATGAYARSGAGANTLVSRPRREHHGGDREVILPCTPHPNFSCVGFPVLARALLSLHKQISIPPFQVMRSYTTLTSRCIYPCIMYIASSCGTCTVISFCAYCSIYDEVNTKGAEANARAPSALRSKIL